jgi:hypothetical protein
MDNSNEERDESDEQLDADTMNCIALILANTKKDLREVVENQLGWEFSDEILRAVNDRLRQCSTCAFWVPIRSSGEPIICAGCLEMSLRSKRFAMTPVSLSDEDVEFLRRVGIKAEK